MLLPFPPRALPRLLLPVLLATAAPALAQFPAGATVQPLPQPNDPAELLAAALRTLAVEPSNLAALTAAGHNALVLGDPNAAVGFFGRAQEIAPRDGRVKAGLGSALIELEKPQDALRLFAEASRLGVPDDEIAEDRGLAYDLTGDPRKAQRDYALVLAAHPDDDVVRRRLALSQGISGDKAAAIATLDPLIRKRDIAGWRAQTFVLAMNGDAKGASDITHIMLPQQADMLQPFLVRLATLSPADKARAVNFGEMPAAGRAYTPTELANTGAAPTYTATANASRPAPTPQLAARVAAPPSDLAPLPEQGTRAAATTAPAPQIAVALPPRVSTASPRPVTVAPPPSYSAAPLAGIALSPAALAPTAPRVATASVPAAQPIPTPLAVAATPPPVRIAQATPAPAALMSGPPAPELPTPAAVGHYDLPHDVAHSPAHPAAPRPAAAVATAATSGTIGTPVVHGATVRPAAPTPAPEPKPTRLASADEPTVLHPARKLSSDDDAVDATTTKHSRARPASVADDETTPAKSQANHGAPSASTNDSEPETKPHKGAHGKSAAADETDDTASTSKSRKTVHGKSAEPDDSDTTSKSRKGGHAARLAAADDASDDNRSKTRKGAHGRKTDDEDAASSRKKESAKAEPERVFVQVAGGANKDDMDKAWAGLRKKAPDLMKGHTPQTTPVHATNRLLVGPFKSDDEAQAFVNKMAAKGLSGFTVKTSKGQKVDKVDSGQ